jgi:hypothetical protein
MVTLTAPWRTGWPASATVANCEPDPVLPPRTEPVTATDSNTFIGVQTLFSSIKNKINFLCYDLGLKEEEIAWCKENNLELKKIELPGCKHIKKWQTYVKPWLVDDSPFEYTVWIDSDCVVVGDLSKSKFIQNHIGLVNFLNYILRS